MNFPGTTTPDLARRTQRRLNGMSAANAVRSAFENRGIL